jgi:hypothetical protein
VWNIPILEEEEEEKKSKIAHPALLTTSFIFFDKKTSFRIDFLIHVSKMWVWLILFTLGDDGKN